ncbi:MAG: HD-GYP domain-containing protein [Alphaproteobacteria bacterium]
MSEHSQTVSPAPGARIVSTVWLAAAALALATALGVVLVFQFVKAERERDFRAWQVRMGIVADSRFAAVDAWLDRQFGQLSELAQNASLQLYVTRLTLLDGDLAQMTDEPAERGYLRNLLVASADRSGFSAPLRGPDVNANVARIGVAGIALLDRDGRVLVATPGMPPLDRSLVGLVLGARGKRALYDLHLGVAGDPTMGFVLPVFAVQSDGAPSDQVGSVVGIKPVAQELFPLLVQPGATETSAETVLLRGTGEAIEYLSPLADGTRALRRTLARDTPGLAAAFALDSPGGFAVRRDYGNAEVLVLARRFAAVPWTLMYKVETAEALAETDNRLAYTLTVFLLIIAAIAVALVASWRHGSSRRANAAAHQAREMARRYQEQHDFLRLVTDSQPNDMAIVGADGRYLWANRTVWQSAGLDRDDIAGKAMSAVIGPVPARDLLRTIRRAIESGESIAQIHGGERDGRIRTYQSKFIPLPASHDSPARVLMASEDITEVLEERARRERIMQQLVALLVGVVDRRDPSSANHSARVAKVARAVAEEMELDPADVECVEVAGRLMNLGKILVPEALLTKTTPLDDGELALIRDSLRNGVELLADIEFTGPVVDTLRQLHEHADGRGALDANGEAMLTARIIAIANTFVALVSPRAYREQLTLDAALDTLLSNMADGANRRVVLALAGYLDNHGGRAALADFGNGPADG